jgi:DNA-binding MarR family transcriptional regulator
MIGRDMAANAISTSDLSDAATRQALEASLRPWIAFLRAHAAVMRRLETELEREQGISLADYDALLQLAMANGKLRMNELADRLLLTRSGASRLVDRLADDGYVERHKCATDARGAYAVITASGRARLRRAAPTHLRGVDDHFMAVLPPADQASFTRALEAILAQLDTDRPGAEADH